MLGVRRNDHSHSASCLSKCIAGKPTQISFCNILHANHWNTKLGSCERYPTSAEDLLKEVKHSKKVLTISGYPAWLWNILHAMKNNTTRTSQRGCKGHVNLTVYTGHDGSIGQTDAEGRPHGTHQAPFKIERHISQTEIQVRHHGKSRSSLQDPLPRLPLQLCW